MEGVAQASAIYIKDNEEVTDIKKFSFEVKGSWCIDRLAETNEG